MRRHIGNRGERERDKYGNLLTKSGAVPNRTYRVWKEYRRACKARLPNWKRYCHENYAQRSTTTFFCVKKSTASQL